MKSTEIAVKRLKVIYYSIIWIVVGFMLFCILGITFNIDHARDDFNKGSKRGWEQGRKEGGMGDNSEFISFSDIFYNPMTESDVRKFDAVASDSLKIETRIRSFDIDVETKGMMVRPPIWKFLTVLLNIFTFVAFVWWLILAVRLFVCMGQSIRRKDIFNMKLIGLHKWFAIMMVVAFSLNKLVNYVDKLFVSQYLKGTEWSFSPELPIPYTIILIGVVFYIISEILKMGYILKEEQELTI